MTEPGAESPIDDVLLREGAAWFARMRGPDAQASKADFEAWLGQGAAQRRAYNRAAEIFAMGKLLAGDPGEMRTAGMVSRRRAVPVLTIAVLLVLVGSLLMLRPWHRPSLAAPDLAGVDRGSGKRRIFYAAGPSETRLARLDDGSTVRLAGGSRLASFFDRTERQLFLLQGVARFHVAHEVRPFVVYAGGGSVIARGTTFDVALTADRRVAVELLEGTVDVKLPRPGAPGGSLVRRLRSGESLSFAVASGGVAAPGASDAIGDGALDYNGISLSELIARANRGGGLQIRLADPALGGLKVSGRFRTGDRALLAQRLAALLDLTAEPTRDGILLK